MKIGLIIGGVLTAVFICYMVVLLAISPIHTIQQLEQSALADEALMSKFDSSLDVPALRPLYRKRTFEEALLQLSNTKAIGLIINLHDSTASLTLNGVMLHIAPLKTMEIDDIIYQANNLIYAKLFSGPIKVRSLETTIVKEPIVERQAPKNEEEALKNVYQPDTLIQKPSFIRFEFESGLLLLMSQVPNLTEEDLQVAKDFHKQYDQRIFQRQLDSLKSFASPYYQPKISLELSALNLCAIYRALPEEMLVVVCQY